MASYDIGPWAICVLCSRCQRCGQKRSAVRGLLSGIKKKKSFVICSGIGCVKGVNADNVASAAIRTDDQIVGRSRADFWLISAHFLHSVRTAALVSIPLHILPSVAPFCAGTHTRSSAAKRDKFAPSHLVKVTSLFVSSRFQRVSAGKNKANRVETPEAHMWKCFIRRDAQPHVKKNKPLVEVFGSHVTLFYLHLITF